MKADSLRDIVRLLLGLAAVVVVLGGFDPLPISANSPPDSSTPPRTFKGVRYRPAVMQGPQSLRPGVATGTLTIGADAIIFESTKLNLKIPVANIWSVSSEALSNDHIRWMVVQYDDAGLLKGAGFEEAQRMFGPDDYDAIRANLGLAESRGRSEPTSVWSQRPLGTGADEGLVEMRHYSFQIPSTGGWTMERPGGPFEEAVLTKQLSGDAGHVQIKILRNQIFSPALVKASARENADSVRNGEKQTMVREGVKPGLYQLHDVSMDEATISEKHFYFMDYTTETSTDLGPSSLYLFFPHERDNTSFIMVVYTAVLAKRPGAIDNSKPDLMSVLSSLKLKSVN